MDPCQDTAEIKYWVSKGTLYFVLSKKVGLMRVPCSEVPADASRVVSYGDGQATENK